MNNLCNQLPEAIDRFNMQYYRRPTKIKVTLDLYNYLATQCRYDVIHTKDDSPRGYTSSIFGIPFEIDNTIANHYELVYEEN